MCTWNGLFPVMFFFLTKGPFSLGLGKDFAVHDGRGGDASRHRVNLEQAAHARRLDGVGHLTVLALIHVLGNHLGKGGGEG